MNFLIDGRVPVTYALTQVGGGELFQPALYSDSVEVRGYADLVPSDRAKSLNRETDKAYDVSLMRLGHRDTSARALVGHASERLMVAELVR